MTAYEDQFRIHYHHPKKRYPPCLHHKIPQTTRTSSSTVTTQTTPTRHLPIIDIQHTDRIFSVAHKQIGGNGSPFHQLSPPSNPCQGSSPPLGAWPARSAVFVCALHQPLPKRCRARSLFIRSKSCARSPCGLFMPRRGPLGDGPQVAPGARSNTNILVCWCSLLGFPC